MKVMENKSRKIIIHTILVLIIILKIDDYSNAKPYLATESEVSEYINIITDFNSIQELHYSFKKIDITEDNTPFLREKVKGKKNVWLVELNNFRLKIKTKDSNLKDLYNRNFKILIDPNNGNLLKISSKYEGYDPNIGTEPNSVFAEGQLVGEKYIGFPDTPPKISFIEALNIVDDFGIGRPYYAKEMDAQYIWYSNIWQAKESQCVWIINLRGVPEIPHSTPPGAPPADIRQVNHIRYVINAVTGEILKCGNSPSPNFETKTKGK